MFFELHDEKKIGYKQLSEADLGLAKSHQTHIGLTNLALTYMSDRNVLSEQSIFIYNDNFEYIDAYFDRIENPDGTFRSPKIRIGDRQCISIVSTIRELVNNNDELNWYLFWFGLKSGKLVFFLFNNISYDYKYFNQLGMKLTKRAKVLSSGNDIFNKTLEYIEKKINQNGIKILKELEVITQTQLVEPNKKYRRYDIDKANERNKKIGRKGEELIDKYLNDQRRAGAILEYIWYNKDFESGLPYDFYYQDNCNNIYYFDVKTTDYEFGQKMVFSTQEVEYALTEDNYSIYRVYKDVNDNYFLRICNDFKVLSKEINTKTCNYINDLLTLDIGFMGAKIAISPIINNLQFNREISLN